MRDPGKKQMYYYVTFELDRDLHTCIKNRFGHVAAGSIRVLSICGLIYVNICWMLEEFSRIEEKDIKEGFRKALLISSYQDNENKCILKVDTWLEDYKFYS